VIPGFHEKAEKQMTRTLVVYYSRTNHTHKIAELIAQGVGANTERILDAQSREGFLGYMRSGRQAMLKRAGQIQPVKEDPSRYDLTILGAPVWSWNLSAPMRAYAAAQKQQFKQVAFFCTEGGAGGPRLFHQLQTICGKTPVATLEVTEPELKSGDYASKVQEFIRQISGVTACAVPESEDKGL
jgi:flavodoxin